MPAAQNVRCTRVSKKVLYETPYIVIGSIVCTGLEKAPKPNNRVDNLDGTWEARDMESVAGYEVVFRKIV